MKSVFKSVSLLGVLCLMLLCGLLRPCAAQRPTLYDASWAGSNATPELLVNVRGGIDNYFGVSAADWTAFGNIAQTDVAVDNEGLHVTVTADVVYFPIVAGELGEPTLATAVLTVTFAPDGKRTEHVEIEAEGLSLVTPEMSIIRGGASFFWLP